MSTSPNETNIHSSVIDLKSFSANDIYSLFELSFELKSNTKKINAQKINANRVTGLAALLFFEPSTRTRFSFEAGCARAGLHPLILDGASGTSLEKGETLEDTILNIEAMKPLFFVIRAPDSLNLRQIASEIKTPVINAGWGMQGHPTQALLDMATVYEHMGDVESRKILFVGDVKHSRVVRSHLELSQILNYEIAYCCPKDFLPSDFSDLDVKYISNLNDGLEWADAVVALRVQKERHIENNFSLEQYIKEYNLNCENLKRLNSKSLIMHPGPINYGVELNKEVLADKRSVILKLVENGTFIREAVIRRIVNFNERE